MGGAGTEAGAAIMEPWAAGFFCWSYLPFCVPLHGGCSRIRQRRFSRHQDED